MLTADQIEFAFLKAADERGLVIRKLVADGRLHRCDAEGRGGKGDGAYIFHPDGVPNGGFQNHRDGLGWEGWKADAPAVLSREQRAELTAKVERQRQERDAERTAAAEEAARRAADFWKRAREADPRHPYLVRKNILPHGVRQLGARLLIPMKGAAGELRGLQWISPDGSKRFLTGTAKCGLAFRIGTLTSVAAIIAVAEGLATASSIFEATGFCTLAAFDCENLLPVARLVRARMPSARIILAGDDDFRTPGNPGRTKAIEAAAAVGGTAVFPAFGPDRGERDTDFNDVTTRHGLEAVRWQIMEALGMS
jgi:putative DNA primase/helicase